MGRLVGWVLAVGQPHQGRGLLRLPAVAEAGSSQHCPVTNSKSPLLCCEQRPPCPVPRDKALWPYLMTQPKRHGARAGVRAACYPPACAPGSRLRRIKTGTTEETCREEVYFFPPVGRHLPSYKCVCAGRTFSEQ